MDEHRAVVDKFDYVVGFSNLLDVAFHPWNFFEITRDCSDSSTCAFVNLYKAFAVSIEAKIHCFGDHNFTILWEIV
jgi:hypothetical protein